MIPQEFLYLISYFHLFYTIQKYIVCDVWRLRSPSFESGNVLYHTPIFTSSMQELIMQRMQQKLQKPCFRCEKNTWHVESNYILQPPKNLIIIINWFRYIDNRAAKDMCSLRMNHFTWSPQIQPAGYRRSSWTIYVLRSWYYLYQLLWKKHSIAMTAKLRSLKWLMPKTPLLHM